MRVVTWNMGCGSPRTAGRFRKVHDEAWRLLLAFEPDVVFAQEAMLDVPSFVRDAGTVVAEPPSYQGQEAGTAILVRGDVLATGEHVRIPGSHLAAAEITHQGQTMFLASVHVETNDQQTNLGSLVEALRPLVDGRRFVIGGDFNAARQCDVVHEKNLCGWFFKELAASAFHDCHFGLHEQEDQSYWGPDTKESYQLDHMFIERTGARRVRSCKVVTNDDTRRLSDHSPVLLDLD